MPSWTPEQFQEYERERLRRAKGKPVDTGLRASEPERHPGSALEHDSSGKGASGQGVVQGARYRITFRIRSLKPCDFDNYFTKPCQDLLVEIGLIPNDDWRTLEGCVISEKADNFAQVGTQITIERLP